MLEYRFLGNAISDWGVALLFIAGAIVIVRLLTILGKRVIIPFINRTENQIDNIIYRSIDAPLKFGLILLGIWIAIHRLVYPDSLVKVVDNTYTILITLDITWVVARLASEMLRNYGQRNGTASKMMPVIRRTVLVVIWIIGLVTALSNVGVDINALLGTLGIGGIAFALAAQDTVKNVFGAFTIFTDKPFGIGDIIRVDGIEGTVVDVGMRSTKIIGYDRRVTTCPNYKLTDAYVVNISSEPMRRISIKLGVEYDTTPEAMELAMSTLRALPAEVEGVSADPADIAVFFTDYADSALVITCYYYIRQGVNILKATSDMNMKILSAMNSAGIKFAYPTQTLYVCDTRG